MVSCGFMLCVCFFFEQKTAYEMRISDWSSDVCSSDLLVRDRHDRPHVVAAISVSDDLAAIIVRRNSVMNAAIPAFRRRMPNVDGGKIGRASCRESVCQYV